MNIDDIPSPAWVCDLAALRRNLELLDRVQRESGAEIVCALKAFAMWSTFPLLREYLAGTTASGLWEARLGREEFGGQVHVYSPAYRDDEVDAILGLADHIVFNSFAQWQRYRGRVLDHPRRPSPGLRVNPGHGEVEVALYNPCAPGSRLGITREQFRPDLLDGIEGLHFHALCEQGADVLERTLASFERLYGAFIPGLKWVNFGGGHHITRAGYEVDRLVRLVRDFRARYGVRVILEPGEAVAWRTGVLRATVLDIVHNDVDIALLDVSVDAHMPDCLEMPYRPEVRGAGRPGEHPHVYRFGGSTCLAGDAIGDYAFPQPLEPGDAIVFEDMIHYTMVKTTMFNGVRHPDIALLDESGALRVVRRFGYEDFRDRLS